MAKKNRSLNQCLGSAHIANKKPSESAPAEQSIYCFAVCGCSAKTYLVAGQAPIIVSAMASCRHLPRQTLPSACPKANNRPAKTAHQICLMGQMSRQVNDWCNTTMLQCCFIGDQKRINVIISLILHAHSPP